MIHEFIMIRASRFGASKVVRKLSPYDTLKRRIIRIKMDRRKKFVKHQKHMYHIVTRSPWPLIASLGTLMLTVGGVMTLHWYEKGLKIFLFGIITIIVVMVCWWRDVVRESTYLGYHTSRVLTGLQMGMILFIVSEVMFFFSFFWAFFHSSLSPSINIGSVWPPVGINILNPLHIPLLNTLILLISGLTVTLSHYSLCVKPSFLVEKSSKLLKNTMLVGYIGLFITILLACEFTLWQIFEYYDSTFYITDGIYGSTFYLTTGFHGFHVFVGTIFLIVGLGRMSEAHFIYNHHFGFEAAIWYWHFVDVVWLFLYIFVYCWTAGLLTLF